MDVKPKLRRFAEPQAERRGLRGQQRRRGCRCRARRGHRAMSPSRRRRSCRQRTAITEPAPAVKTANATAAKLSSVSRRRKHGCGDGRGRIGRGDGRRDGARSRFPLPPRAQERAHRVRESRAGVPADDARTEGAAEVRRRTQRPAGAAHVLASQITAAAPLLQSLANVEGQAIEPVQRALAVIRDNLAQAQAASRHPTIRASRSKQLRRELDSMVVARRARRRDAERRRPGSEAARASVQADARARRS